MNEYLLRVMGTVLVSALITAIAPEGKTSATVKGVAKLICVLAIVTPVLRFFKVGDVGGFTDKNRQDFFSEEVIDADETFIQYYSEKRIRQAEAALEEDLLNKYGLIVEVIFDWVIEKEIKLERICIKLPKNTGVEVKREMLQYLTENYCSEVLIE